MNICLKINGMITDYLLQFQYSLVPFLGCRPHGTELRLQEQLPIYIIGWIFNLSQQHVYSLLTWYDISSGRSAPYHINYGQRQDIGYSGAKSLFLTVMLSMDEAQEHHICCYPVLYEIRGKHHYFRKGCEPLQVIIVFKDQGCVELSLLEVWLHGEETVERRFRKQEGPM